jgi:uroporphyrinogen-III decarboxylase
MEHLVKERGDLAKLRYLMPEPQAADFAHIARAQERAGELALIEARPTLGTDHDFVDAIGIGNCMILFYEDREFFDEALRFFHEYHLKALHHACHSGAEVIFGSWYNFSLGAGWSPAIYRQAFLPLIRDCAALVHEHELLYHLYDDGKCWALLPDWVEAGADCISTLPPPPMGDVDLAEAKQSVGSQVCLKGNVDLFNVIMLMRPEEIREVVRRTLQAGAAGGRFILSTSDSIRGSTPIENLRACMEAGREFAATYL